MQPITLTVPITLPDGIELIEIAKREQLEADQQVKINLHEAAEISGFTEADLKTVFRKFKSQLDIDNGGCVYFPVRGGKYEIESLGFIKFVRLNFRRIMKELKK